ncbi:hypothetical protein Q4530_15535 [Colwellia sp. 1_MG-2023]|jgi:hypothetical protein|uniref:hypothetical protein n=1 Tax=unclassified Colwellia TaxID=196834 RepID=UPI001C08F59E|nr:MULTISPECIES: hypothetical protein [unclassified Colwellia]MBU2924661.1 hypothetical protein [Colwellia sp. C2M11]MDO6653917.1 hypothetical protein [Colwellia sp. 3_MG-2023]MDO6666744.1 hypothetical protein [Colwellia sp. 2_MG-2023]MDO6691185.1 hypothetical protein [Colwellia sp. 1_MG-2023]
MTINDEISIVANKIANEGNKPSVALIKTKLNKKVPLPTIISVLKNWQHEPSFISLPEEKHTDVECKTDNPPTEKRSFEKDVRDELTSLKEEVLELKTLIKQLLK